MKTRNAEVRFPESVRTFVHANPGYWRGFAHTRLPPHLRYFQAIANDWHIVRPHIPRSARHVLDIGCGIAGIDLLLYRAGRRPQLCLVDQARRVQPEGCFSVVNIARDFLSANGVPREHVETLDCRAHDLGERIDRHRYDVVLSVRALGYMFPYALYRETLRRVIDDQGRLFMDVRIMDPDRYAQAPSIYRSFRRARFPVERSAIAQLQRDFMEVVEIGRSWTSIRLCAQRPRRPRRNSQ